MYLRNMYGYLTRILPSGSKSRKACTITSLGTKWVYGRVSDTGVMRNFKAPLHAVEIEIRSSTVTGRITPDGWEFPERQFEYQPHEIAAFLKKRGYSVSLRPAGAFDGGDEVGFVTVVTAVYPEPKGE